MVIRPYGYAIWEHIQRELDDRFKATGHVNAYFPLFIPESLLMREAQHVEGFAPQVAWVTKGGTEELEEKLIVRPTSETIFGVMYQKWIQSWRDLPVLINQWANVVRWEKVTRPFLRTTEFLWQEGHTAHETADEAQEETLKILDLYTEFCENVLAMPVVEGPEEREREVRRRVEDVFDRGADGRRPRAAGRHVAQPRAELRQGVRDSVPGPRQDAAVRVDDVVGRVDAADRRRDHDARRRQRPDAAARGRAVAGGHRADSARQLEGDGAAEVRARFATSSTAAGIRVRLDADESQTPGWKFAEYEMRGVPLRLEIGPKDIEKNAVFAARRDTRQKQSLPMEGLADRVKALLDEIQASLLERARGVPRGAHEPHRQLRRVQADHGRPSRLRDRAVVRVGAVRGGDQGRDAGHDPQHAVRPGHADRAVHQVRQAGDGVRLVREGVLSR